MIFYIGSGKELLAGIVDKIEDDILCAVTWAKTSTIIHANCKWEPNTPINYEIIIWWPQDPSFIIVCPD